VNSAHTHFGQTITR